MNIGSGGSPLGPLGPVPGKAIENLTSEVFHRIGVPSTSSVTVPEITVVPPK